MGKTPLLVKIQGVRGHGWNLLQPILQLLEKPRSLTMGCQRKHSVRGTTTNLVRQWLEGLKGFVERFEGTCSCSQQSLKVKSWVMMMTLEDSSPVSRFFCEFCSGFCQDACKISGWFTAVVFSHGQSINQWMLRPVGSLCIFLTSLLVSEAANQRSFHCVYMSLHCNYL